MKVLNSNCIFGPERFYMAKIYLSLGSNQGDRLKSLVAATKLIDSLIGDVSVYSSVYESEPWGFEADTSFYNLILMAETLLTPMQILAKILDIETTLGRIRSGTVYSSRTIDIDILFYDHDQISGDKLVIPHPLLHKRRFVLEPLAEIAEDFIHPVARLKVSELLQGLEDESYISVAVEKNALSELLNL
jgi:deoxyguanosine kinase